MAFRFPLSTTGTASAVTLTDGDYVYVGRNVFLGTTDASNQVIDGVVGDGYQIIIAGVIAGAGSAIWLSSSLNPTSRNNHVTIEATGDVRALGNNGSNTLVVNGSAAIITNAGFVYAENTVALFLGGQQAASGSQITNRGTIKAGDGMAIGRFAQLDAITLTNTGTISGEEAYVSYGGPTLNKDTIYNSGRIFGTIELDGGNDTYNGAAGRFTGTLFGGDGVDTLIGGVDGNEFRGGAGNDMLTGNGGNDTLKGDAGNDKLNGGVGRDILTGGANADTFIFSAKSHSVLGSNADRIMDFDDGGTGDKIDLSSLMGPALQYIHSQAFTNVGQVRINDVSGADVVIEVNLSGTSGADFSIRLLGTTLASMTKGDFIL